MTFPEEGTTVFHPGYEDGFDKHDPPKGSGIGIICEGTPEDEEGLIDLGNSCLGD